MIIDLTINVSIDNPIFDWVKSQSDIPIAMGHIGTHLDTHLKTDIPIEYFKSRGVIFSVVDIDEIDLEHIDIEKVNEGDFVLFYTNYLDKVGYGGKRYFREHPQLSNNLIELLIARKIRFIGIDAAGIRRADEHRKADCLCENNSVYIIENLSNLDKLPIEKRVTVYTMWMDDKKMTGLRCRVLAEML